ncbi:type II secretion system secretin GspD [Ideonella alba]|uniref:Type IV pilus biogenesis and competence protein PilQ n=1 Tax=Ideonella alba TaxID=2824118 RepID=A0A940Y8G8_9BURK|nr:type II secretion system secretin GspD [Ideonella alba]MBQ0930591.1 type II secretion system secretin GspD [Ideonella alba]
MAKLHHFSFRHGALALALALAWPVQAADGDMPMPATRAKAPVTLNFVNAEIEMVSRAIGTMLDRQILVDPRVKGSLTITSDKALPPQEAWRSYLAALRGLGFTVVENAGLLKVVPEAEAKLQAGTVVVGAPTVRGDQILTQIFRLNHENPNSLVAILRPLISANNTINANAGNGTLVITDYADNLQRLAKIIAALDQPAASEVEVVTLKHALASELQPLVQKLSESAPTPGVPGAAQSQSAATSVMAEPRSNSLIVRAANPARLASVKALIDKLDKPIADGGPAGQIRVVYLKNADATKLAEVLRAVLASATSGAGAGSGGSSSLTGLEGGSRPGSIAGTGSSTSSSNTGVAGTGGASAAATTPVASSARPSTGGQIQADPATNSLIISAPEPVYRQLRQVIDQLDTRRAQIFVESMIVKVDASKTADFGIQWQGLLSNSSNTRGIVAGTNFGSGGNNIINLSLGGATASTTGTTGTSITVPGQGLNIGFINKLNGVYTLGTLARFLETQAGANILSTPTLLALDNEEAKIVVGQNVPFITGSFTNTGTGSGATNPFQTIERKDVGLTLRVKSQVGEGGTVRMTIYQENSSVNSNTTSGLITDKSAVETTVVVDDGQMMVLGGLMKDEFTDSDGRVPGLASVPILGNLFRNDSRTRVKSNLMIFLRPVVVRDQGSSDRIALDRYEAIRATQRSTQPEPSILTPINEAPVLPELPGTRPAQPAPATTAPATTAPN